jgi:hypothetical protein
VAGGPAFWSGSLDGLARAGGSGVATGWTPRSAGKRTFRIVADVADDPRAMGATVTADLVWTLRPATTPTTRPTIEPEGTPASHPPSTGKPATGNPATGKPTTSRPTSSPETRPTGSASAVPPRTGKEFDIPGAHGGGTPAGPSRTDQVIRFFQGVAFYSGFPLLLFLLVLLFLLIQDRLDRKDPKLAAAPLYADPDQSFPEHGTTPWRPVEHPR